MPHTLDTNPAKPSGHRRDQAMLAQPQAAFLAQALRSRLHADKRPPRVLAPNQPVLPNASRQAIALYLERSKVDSFPLLFTTMALAHPN